MALNLILAVIVDKAEEVREEDIKHRTCAKAKQRDESCRVLKQICQEMDKDKSGSLTLRELTEGFECKKTFGDMMSLMDVAKEDLELVFSILDEDDSGDVIYEEFVNQIHKMKSSDNHTLLIFIKCYVSEIKQKVTEELRLIKEMLSRSHKEASNTSPSLEVSDPN